MLDEPHPVAAWGEWLMGDFVRQGLDQRDAVAALACHLDGIGLRTLGGLKDRRLVADDDFDGIARAADAQLDRARTAPIAMADDVGAELGDGERQVRSDALPYPEPRQRRIEPSTDPCQVRHAGWHD